MSLGNFKETSESSETSEAAETSETNETKDATDDTEKSRSQILDTPDKYDDDFDKKLDDCESDQDSPEQNSDDDPDSSSQKGEGEEKQSLLDKMRSLFSKKEGAEAGDTKADEGTEESKAKEPSQREKFLESVRVDDYQVPALDKAESNSGDKPDESSESDDARGIEHGEDGERTRWSDAQYAREHNIDER